MSDERDAARRPHRTGLGTDTARAASGRVQTLPAGPRSGRWGASRSDAPPHVVPPFPPVPQSPAAALRWFLAMCSRVPLVLLSLRAAPWPRASPRSLSSRLLKRCLSLHVLKDSR